MKEKNVVITGYVDQTYSAIKENVIKQGGNHKRKCHF